MSKARQYAEWVLDPKNERETGRLIKLAAQRFMNDLKRTDIYFDPVEAVKMPDFCENHLCQWEGEWEGKPFVFELWQRFIFEQIYGWFRVDTNTRRFTEVYVQVSKKNGKSSGCAGVMNFHVFGDDRVNTPKVFTGANNEEQAKIAVNMSGRMIQAAAKYIDDSPFADMLETDTIGIMNYKENITEVLNRENNGFIKAFAKESSDKKSKTAGGKHGINASLGVIDEFGMSPDHGASKAIRSSMASRRERLMFYITTAGFNLDGPCYRELRKIGIDVLEGTITKDDYLPIIFEIDKPVGEDGKVQDITVDWLLENEWAWKQSNPNLEVSVFKDFLRSELLDAKVKGGSSITETLTLNFNLWMDSPEVFIPADVWNKNTCSGRVLKSSDDCFAGLEVGPSGDITAMSLLFPGDIVAVKMTWIIAGDALKLTETYRENEELINVDPGNVVDNDFAIQKISEQFQKYSLHSFAFPKPQENNSVVQGLIKLGYVGNPISQGVVSISNPTDEWEKMLRAGMVDHYSDPILAWQNSNCLAIRKEQGTRIEKNGKVLGIYACINAVAQWKTISSEDSDDKIIEQW